MSERIVFIFISPSRDEKAYILVYTPTRRRALVLDESRPPTRLRVLRGVHGGYAVRASHREEERVRVERERPDRPDPLSEEASVVFDGGDDVPAPCEQCSALRRPRPLRRPRLSEEPELCGGSSC